MCTVSMVSDYYWPGNPAMPLNPWPPQYIPFRDDYFKPAVNPIEKSTVEELQKFAEIMEKARKYDELNKEADCPDPEKIKVFDAVIDKILADMQILLKNGDYDKVAILTNILSDVILLKREITGS